MYLNYLFIMSQVKLKTMQKLKFLLATFLIFSTPLFADDSKILNEVEIEIRKAKTELLKWDKTHMESDLNAAIEILKNARIMIGEIKTFENVRAIDLNKELSMLYFWANKSKRVTEVKKDKAEIQQFKKSVEEVEKEEKKSPNSANKANESISQDDMKTLESILSSKISVDDIVIPVEHPIITGAFQKAIEYSKNNPDQLYECEFMFRDIYYDFPTSKSAILAKELANKFSEKIEAFVKEKQIIRNLIKSKILNYDSEYNSRNYEIIISRITEMRKNEKDHRKQDIYWEMIEEYKYLQTAISALNDLLFMKKHDAPSASIVGVKFRGFVTSSSNLGLDITTDMGSMSIPWIKISDEQLGKLLAILSKGVDVSYKIPIAIHLLGNTQDAFQILYQRSLDNPLIMAKYSRFYFQTLFYFRKEMANIIDQQIGNAQKLFSNKDTTGAIGVLTQSLLSINKNNFLRDQIGKIHEVMSTFNH